MKTPDMQILSMLQAFKPEAVFKAFVLYEASYTSPEDEIKKQMEKDGWYLVDRKPEEMEFYNADDDKYWVQNEEGKKRDKEKIVKELADKKARAIEDKKNKKNTSAVVDPRLTKILCPVCGNRMYKQSVCVNCSEGKKGFKIRLICEDNPDHEVLL